MYIKRSTKASLKARSAGDTKGNNRLKVRIRITFDGNPRLEYGLPVMVLPSDWDKRLCRVKGGVKYDDGLTSSKINKVINDAIQKVDDIFSRYELIEKRTPSREEMRAELDAIFLDGVNMNTQTRQELDVWQVIEIFCEQQGAERQWTNDTHQKFTTLGNHIKNYQSNLLINDITDQTLTDFAKYLSDVCDLRNTTIRKQMQFFKWLLKWASLHGYYNGTAHLTYSPRLKGGEKSSEPVVLSLDEIKAMMALEFADTETRLEKVRDVFVFCCFTGLRYSDVAKLKHSDIRNGKMHIVTKKTVDALNIDLNDIALSLLEKYKNYSDTYALPVPSNVKYNEYIKEVARLANINDIVTDVYFKGSERFEQNAPKWSVISTHTARRTFVTLSLYLGIPSEVIMRWTGHKNHKAMQPYVKIVDKLKAKEMEKFNGLLNI